MLSNCHVSVLLKTAWIDNELYVEVHPGLDQSTHIERDGGLPNYSLSDEEMKMIMKAVSKEDFDLLDWEALWKAVRTRGGYPVMIAQRPLAEKISELLPEKEAIKGQNISDPKEKVRN